MQKLKGRIFQSEEFEVGPWGIAALACGTMAVLSANLAALIPGDALRALHMPYRDTGSFNQMRAQLVELEQDRNRLLAEQRTLLTRFNLLYDDSSELVRRVAAVEMSLPLLIESLPLESDIDRSLLTAAITDTAGEIHEAEGGNMVVRYTPLFSELAPAMAEQPMPPALPQPTVPPYGPAQGE